MALITSKLLASEQANEALRDEIRRLSSESTEIERRMALHVVSTSKLSASEQENRDLRSEVHRLSSEAYEIEKRMALYTEAMLHKVEDLTVPTPMPTPSMPAPVPKKKSTAVQTPPVHKKYWVPLGNGT